MLPYLYSLAHEASKTGHPMIRPLVYHFPTDPYCQSASFEFMLGPFLLVASIVEEGATTRPVHLPNGTDWCCIWSGKWYQGGQDVVVEVPLKQHGAVFARNGSLIPMGGMMKYVGEKPDDERVVQVYVGHLAGRYEYVMTDDSGENVDGTVGQVRVWAETSEESDVVTVGLDILVDGGVGIDYHVVWFVLPFNDTRKMVVVGSGAGERIADDGRQQVGVFVSKPILD